MCLLGIETGYPALLRPWGRQFIRLTYPMMHMSPVGAMITEGHALGCRGISSRNPPLEDAEASMMYQADNSAVIRCLSTGALRSARWSPKLRAAEKPNCSQRNDNPMAQLAPSVYHRNVLCLILLENCMCRNLGSVTSNARLQWGGFCVA